jgi:hypothetical protein
MPPWTAKRRRDDLEITKRLTHDVTSLMGNVLSLEGDGSLS